jgi:hypothetical protein
MPIKFSFKPQSTREQKLLKIVYHESELFYYKLRPNGKNTNYSFRASSMQKNIDRLTDEVWKNEQKETVTGYLV